MIPVKTICTIILFLSTNISFVHAQARLAGVMDVEKHNHQFTYKHVTNEATFLLTTMFIFYKSFISSQDGGACTFTPSCSEYGLQAVSKKGVVIGMLATFDRLTRCHGLSAANYKYDFKRKLLIDPVE